jgi:hypothetical protein
MTGVEVRMSDEAGRHFIGPVPAERECAGRNFRITSASKGSDSGTIFRCLRCARDLEGAYLPHGKSHLNRPGGQIP